MKRKEWLTICLLFVISGLCALYAARAKAQVITQATIGANFSMTINGMQYVSLPVCSKAAGCAASLEICDLVSGKADSTHCILIGNGLAGSSSFWLGVNNTITTSTGSSSTPIQIGTATITVPAAEVRQTP